MKRTHRLVFGIILALLAAALVMPAGLVAAEAEPPSISDVQVWVFPEFDDPRLLVMIQGRVDGLTPPATVRFLVPDSAEMYSAGSKDAQDNYLNPSGGPPRREPSEISGWDEISYEVVTNVFRVEYYAPLIVGSPDKTITYDFYTRYDIDGLSISVQEPRNSSDFSILPDSSARGSEFGLDVWRYNYDSLKAGDALRFDVSYTRSDPNPSMDGAPVGSTPTAPVSTGGGGDAGLITGGITGGLLIVALIAYLLFGRAGTRKPARARAASRGAAQAKAKASTKYCRQCGRQIEKSARFCQYCGSAQ
jgi:hypothetical protein